MFSSPQLLPAFILFAIISSITPGPNNTMLLASGINFGFRRSFPHIIGISSGFFVMIICLGLGLESLFAAYPVLYTILRYLSAIYLLYLAWKIAKSHPFNDDTENLNHPLSFWGAAAFQWVNPKAWIMAISAISTYLPQNHQMNFGESILQIAIISLLYAIINAPCVGLWAAIGSLLRSILQDLRWRRIINLIMALLLIISLYPILTET